MELTTAWTKLVSLKVMSRDRRIRPGARRFKGCLSIEGHTYFYLLEMDLEHRTNGIELNRFNYGELS